MEAGALLGIGHQHIDTALAEAARAEPEAVRAEADVAAEPVKEAGGTEGEAVKDRSPAAVDA